MKIYDNQVGSLVHLSTVYAKGIISQYYYWPSEAVSHLKSSTFYDSAGLSSSGSYAHW